MQRWARGVRSRSADGTRRRTSRGSPSIPIVARSPMSPNAGAHSTRSTPLHSTPLQSTNSHHFSLITTLVSPHSFRLVRKEFHNSFLLYLSLVFRHPLVNHLLFLVLTIYFLSSHADENNFLLSVDSPIISTSVISKFSCYDIYCSTNNLKWRFVLNIVLTLC